MFGCSVSWGWVTASVQNRCTSLIHFVPWPRFGFVAIPRQVVATSGLVQRMETHAGQMLYADVAARTRAAFEGVMEHLPPGLRKAAESGEVADTVARINVNAHGMAGGAPYTQSFGAGVFPYVALINHSCFPNAVFVADGNQLQVRAVDNIAVGEVRRVLVAPQAVSL